MSIYLTDRAATPRALLRWVFIALTLSSIGSTSAWSQDGHGTTANDVTALPRATFSSTDYLAAAARLTIRFQNYPELTGDYRIGPDDTISIPVIGRTTLKKKDTVALENELRLKTSNIAQKDVYVTVEIAAYQNVFVTGAVKRPGAIEWQPNMTVLQAIALAGGMTSAFLNVASSEWLIRPQVIYKTIEVQKRDLAALARLRAAHDGKAEIEIPSELVNLAGLSQAKKLIEREAEILASERQSMAEKIEILRQGIAAEKKQIASLRDQMKSLKTQLEKRNSYLSGLLRLKSKGLLTTDQLMLEEIKVTDIQEKISNIDVGIAKSSGALASLQLNKVAFQRDRHSGIVEEISKIERRSVQQQIDIEAEGGVPTNYRPIKASDSNNDGVSPYQIVRRSAGTQTITADHNTALRPGDVLIVAKPQFMGTEKP